MQEGYLRHLHQFRGLAIVLIVGVHCRTSLDWPVDSLLNNLLIYALDSSTILFVFISGYLFQHLNAKQFDFGKYLSKKFTYVIVPYLLISIPALVDKLFFETEAAWMTPFYKDLSVPFKAVYLVVTGKHSGPFYFIPTIAFIYLIAPFLYKFQKAAFFDIGGLLVAGIGLFTFTYGYYATIPESILYFLPVYIFGMWISKHSNRVLAMSNTIFFVITASYFMLLSFEISGLIQPEHLRFFEKVPTYFTSTFNLSKMKEMLLAIVLLNAFYRLRNRPSAWLKKLGDYSFGIYFVHIYFINAFERSLDHFSISRIQNGIGYLLFTLCVLLLSILTVALVKRLFRNHSRMIIGS